MRDVALIDRPEQAAAAFQPLRLSLLRRLHEPRSCTELARELGHAPQKVYYHVKVLEAAGLVEQVNERRVRGINEGVYRAVAEAYWLSPLLVGPVAGKRKPTDAVSLAFLLRIAEELQVDVARLAARAEEVHSLGLAAEVRLAPEQRERFRLELQHMLEELLGRYGGGDGDTFRIAVACYPKGEEDG